METAIDSSIDLKEKIAVITGAGGGIGEALVMNLKKAGAICILVEREISLLDKFKDLLDNQMAIYECDLTDLESVKRFTDKIKSDYNQIDLLFNIAGIGIYKNIEDLSVAEWTNSMAVNLTAPFVLIKNLLPLLKKSEKAFILNFGSGMGKNPTPGRAAYCASKFGLRGMSLSLNKELKNENIDVSLLTLGSVMTNFGSGGIEHRREMEKNGKKYLTTENVVDEVMRISTSDEKEPEYFLYPDGYEA